MKYSYLTHSTKHKNVLPHPSNQTDNMYIHISKLIDDYITSTLVLESNVCEAFLFFTARYWEPMVLSLFSDESVISWRTGNRLKENRAVHSYIFLRRVAVLQFFFEKNPDYICFLADLSTVALFRSDYSACISRLQSPCRVSRDSYIRGKTSDHNSFPVIRNVLKLLLYSTQSHLPAVITTVQLCN